MTNDNSHDDVCNVWQEQPSAPFVMTPAELRVRMKRLGRQLLIRDVTVYGVCLLEIAVFAYMLIVFPQLMVRVGSLLVILGMAFLIAQIWLDRRGRKLAHADAAGLGTTDSIKFYRGELARQREFHRGIWLWSRLVALFPGLLVFGLAAGVALPYPANFAGHVVVGVAALLCPLAIRLNLTRSRNYQCRINALDRIMNSQN
jgi:hypothetical protein